MKSWIALATVPLAAAASAQVDRANVERVPLMAQSFGREVPVSEVRSVRVDFRPGQQSGRHLHPVPTFGVVLEGRVLLQVEGGAAQIVSEGESFYEPAGRPILRFDNASQHEPASFAAFYLLGKPGDVVVLMLDLSTGKAAGKCLRMASRPPAAR